METRFEFKGTGGELFKQLFVGMLLCSITFGIYFPWFVVAMHKMILERTTVRVGDREIRLTFTGTGGDLFKHLFLGYMFTLWTLGIYLPWFMVRLMKFQQEHTVAIGDARYHVDTDLTGGTLFKTLIGGYLLTGITFGIYFPWFFVKLVKTVVESWTLYADDRPIGQIRFTLTGGEFFKTFIVGYLLTGVTMGIYFWWFQVKLFQLFARSTEISIGEQKYRGDFAGTGGENFKVNFVGYLLTMITFGIYSFWYMANLLRFQLENTRFLPADGEVEPSQRRLSKVRVSSSGLAPAAAAKPSRAASQALPPAVAGDRRAAWARAFLPPPSSNGSRPANAAWQGGPDPVAINEVWTDSASPRRPFPPN